MEKGVLIYRWKETGNVAITMLDILHATMTWSTITFHERAPEVTRSRYGSGLTWKFAYEAIATSRNEHFHSPDAHPNPQPNPNWIKNW